MLSRAVGLEAGPDVNVQAVLCPRAPRAPPCACAYDVYAVTPSISRNKPPSIFIALFLFIAVLHLAFFRLNNILVSIRYLAHAGSVAFCIVSAFALAENISHRCSAKVTIPLTYTMT